MAALIAVARLLTLLAMLGLGPAGGSYSHGTEGSHTHAAGSHHAPAHEHIQMAADCCDPSSNETVHCGANLLAVTSRHDCLLLQTASLRQMQTYHLRRGIYRSIELPPPRAILPRPNSNRGHDAAQT